MIAALEKELKYLAGLTEQALISQGVNASLAMYLNLLVNLFVLFLVLIASNYLVKRFVIEAFKSFTNKTRTTFDDFLIKSNFPLYIGQIIPLFLLYITVPIIFSEFEIFLDVFNFVFDIYVIILIIWICRSILRTAKEYLKTLEEFKDKPLESYIQVLMILVWIVGLMFVFARVFDKDVVNFVISLGAASAVLLLIFKDTILGFVASIQVSVNDIVRIGDWITFSKYGADGNVTEINLATVRVQNFDNTFTTIPTYSLISDSFQNWRGMQESAGRRIKRAIYIKQNSVKFLSKEDLENYHQIDYIKDYVKSRQTEIDNFNKKNKSNRNLAINGRNQTNLGIFRKYIDTYLKDHSAIHNELYTIVRHLAPSDKGIPIEILCFSKDKRWENFEYITADIFDHIIAAVPYFNLTLFESPSGDDIARLVEIIQKKPDKTG